MPNDNGQDREPLNSSSPFIRQRLGSSSSADGDTQDSPLTISVSDPTQKGESSFWSGTKLVWYYIFAEVKRQPLSFVLAVFTVFITVLVISLLASAVSTSNLIFFRMAEINAGMLLMSVMMRFMYLSMTLMIIYAFSSSPCLSVSSSIYLFIYCYLF